MRRLQGTVDRIRLPAAEIEIEYRIEHRPRVTRRIHLDIDEQGRLLVVAPRALSRRAIRRALHNKAPQVQRFLSVARSRQRETAPLRYADGAEHLYLGDPYPLVLRMRPGQRQSVDLADGVIAVSAKSDDPDRVRNQLFQWYRRVAQTYFSQRLQTISSAAPWTGGCTPALRLRLMKRTWGNCTADGRITLNTALVKAPPELIDYVICHEVCHLREHNHGPAFYRLQQQLFPRWRAAKQQLAESGHLYLHS